MDTSRYGALRKPRSLKPTSLPDGVPEASSRLPRWRQNRLGSWAGRGHPPDGVSDIVGDEQGARLVDCQPNRPSARLTIVVQEAGHDILGLAARMPAAERHEHDLVPVEGSPVPAAVLADESAAAILCGKAAGSIEHEPKWS